MTLRILSVAYPLAPVRRNAVGGAEQILAEIDAALVERGHRSRPFSMRLSRIIRACCRHDATFILERPLPEE